jgi:TolB-like protein/DNA-binding winged helix-turn-helix (wHTH) protein
MVSILRFGGGFGKTMISYTDLMKGFELGDVTVLPERNLVRRGDQDESIELKVMNVLVVLASHQGDLVSKDQIVDAVWDGRATSDEVITRCISKIRLALGDTPKDPKYIENVRGRGYRLIAPVKALADAPEITLQSATSVNWRVPGLAALVLLALIGVISFWPEDAPIKSEAITSVAILPFRNLGNEEDQYLCEGFTEELIYTLSGISDLKVAKGGPAGADGDYVEMARQLGVEGIVVGSLRRDGDKVRITAQLHDGRDGFSRWSEIFDDAVSDTFALQERVAESVRAVIEGDRQAQSETSATSRSAEAYDSYLRARYLLGQRSPASLTAAIDLFDVAIQNDRKFGMAYVSKAYAYLLLPSYLGAKPEPMYELAIATVDEGVRNDPTIANTSDVVRAFIFHKRGEWDKAQQAFESALQARPVYPTANHWYSRFLASVGLLEASLEQARLARELEPLSPVFNSRLAIAYFWMDDLDNAEKYFTIANQLGMSAPIHFESYAMYLLRKGQVEEAKKLVTRTLSDYGGATDWVDPVFEGLAHDTARPAALAALDRAVTHASVSPREEVVLWTMLGDTPRALDVARLLVGGGEVFELELLFSSELTPLREHEGFEKFLADVGLKEFWSGQGCNWNGDSVDCVAAGN